MYLQATVTLMVTDMDRAVQFYTDALRLSLKVRYGGNWAEVQAPGLLIGLHPAAEPTPPGGNASIGLQVANLETAMSDLQAKGVSFNGDINDDGFVRIAHFSDPDGTTLYLCQTKL